MKDKYNLTVRENIFVAKKLLAQNIYRSAKLEGCNITFPETQTILDGVSVAGLKMSDVEVVLNLRDAWRYLIDTIEEPLSLEYISKINGYVSRNESLDWGVLRYGDVGISGTSYRPPIPNEPDVVQTINQIITADKSSTEKAIELFLYGCRNQNYWDGNKRTSTLVANKYMIMNACGIFSVPDDKLGEFNQMLREYYESGNPQEIKTFLYDNAIGGMIIDRDLQKKAKQSVSEKPSVIAQLEAFKENNSCPSNAEQSLKQESDLER